MKKKSIFDIHISSWGVGGNVTLNSWIQVVDFRNVQVLNNGFMMSGMFSNKIT